jgi:hypothetical protein
MEEGLRPKMRPDSFLFRFFPLLSRPWRLRREGGSFFLSGERYGVRRYVAPMESSDMFKHSKFGAAIEPQKESLRVPFKEECYRIPGATFEIDRIFLKLYHIMIYFHKS